ncbi:MAG: hypothetical protein R3F54_31955 [Alphaproteobacteria bacterium]
MEAVGSTSASGGAGVPGTQVKSSAARDQHAAFAQAMSEVKGQGDQPQDISGEQEHDGVTCTVDVRSKRIGATLGTARHAYIVTTENGERPEGDPPYLGSQTLHRGGPESRVQDPTDASSWGDIITDSEEFKKGALDHHGSGKPHPSVPVKTFDGTCDAIDRKLEAAGQQIEVEGHEYRAWPDSQNSNTAARAMLERAGLPIPDDPYGWTPGWDADLPKGKAVKEPIN